MKMTLRALALSTVALSLVAPALAADLPFAAPVFSAPVVPADVVVDPVNVSVYDWSGFYAGVVAGHTWGNSAHQDPASDRFDVAGWLAGANVGYNFQFDNVVLGLEGDVVWTDLAGSNDLASTKIEWSSSLKARAGYAFDNVLPYVVGGFTLADVKGSGVGYDTNERQFGAVLGAGVEYGVTENISLKAEYNYTHFFEGNVLDRKADQTVDLRGHTFKTGLSFSF